jgi:prophage antirepressor-like protein
VGAVLFCPQVKNSSKMFNLKILPFSYNGSTLNTVQEENEPLFIAKDVTDILGYKTASDALRGLDDDEKLLRTICVSGQNREINFINESGLYSLILRSKKPEAKQFKRWVTHEVLPAIRKNGGYLTPGKTEELLANPDLIIELATNLKNERKRLASLMTEIDDRNEIIDFQDQHLKIQAPIVAYYRNVLNSSDTVTTNVIAKELGMSAISLNKILHEEYNMIYRSGDTWVLYAKYQKMELTRTKTHSFTGSLGELRTSIQTVWTQKGRNFLHELLKDRK